MAIKSETAGEGAIGADAAPPVRPAKRSANGPAPTDRPPLGLVALEAEVEALKAQAARIEALERHAVTPAVTSRGS